MLTLALPGEVLEFKGPVLVKAKGGGIRIAHHLHPREAACGPG